MLNFIIKKLQENFIANCHKRFHHFCHKKVDLITVLAKLKNEILHKHIRSLKKHTF